MRKTLGIVALLVAVSAAASELRISVQTQPVSAGEGKPLLYVVWHDQPIRLKLVLIASDLRMNPISEDEEAALRRLPAAAWPQQIRLTIRDTETKRVVRTEDGGATKIVRSTREDHGPNASRKEWLTPGRDYLQYDALVELAPLPPGSYEISAELHGLKHADVFVLSNGTERPELRFAYLGRLAARAGSYEEYKRLQLERANVEPHRAAPLIELGHRAMRDGTLDEANRFFDLAADAFARNVKRQAALYPAKAASFQATTGQALANLRDLQKLLPDYFARRGELRVEQVTRNGVSRWVLLDRQGRIVREP